MILLASCKLTKAVSDVIDVRLRGLERLMLISGNLHSLYSKLKLTVKFDSSSDFQMLLLLQFWRLRLSTKDAIPFVRESSSRSRKNGDFLSEMAIFGDFFASCIFSEPRAAHFRPAFYIRTKATPCVEVW